MRNVFAICVALTLTGASFPALATEPTAAAVGKPAEVKPENKLDTLFSELKRERNEKAAERIASRIWEEWGRSGSASVDLMMMWSKTAMDTQKFDVALDFLDQVVTLKPDFAEGWNRRATVHFMMQNYSKSMADINRTLRSGAPALRRPVRDGPDHEEHRPQATGARSMAARSRHLSDDAQRPERGGLAVGRAFRRRHLIAPSPRIAAARPLRHSRP